MNVKYVAVCVVTFAIGLILGIIVSPSISTPSMIDLFDERKKEEYPLQPTFETITGRLWRITHGMGICAITFTDNTKILFYDSTRTHSADLEKGLIYKIYYIGESEPYTFEKAELITG